MILKLKKKYGEMNRSDGKQTCAGDNAHLPIPRSKEENEFYAGLRLVFNLMS